MRAHLGDADFEAEYGRGTRLDLRSAVDLALNMGLTPSGAMARGDDAVDSS